MLKCKNFATHVEFKFTYFNRPNIPTVRLHRWDCTSAPLHRFFYVSPVSLIIDFTSVM